MQSATPTSNRPLGGTSGDWPRRLLRHHVPLALASAVVIVLFMALPLFDPQAYPSMDMGSGGAFPQPIDMEDMDHGEDQADPMDESGDQSDHGRGQADPMHDGESQAGTTGHGEDQTGLMDDGGDQTTGRTSSHDVSPSLFTVLRLSRFTAPRLTTATGYVATGLLALTLLIGPANLLLRRRNPVSNYLTRDLGTWAAIFSVVHVFFGLQLHSGGQLSNLLRYFVAPDGSPLTNSFGLGNWTGLTATVIVVGLLAISNDAALQKLKARRWKNLQRLNYALFALVILHAFFYGALLRMASPYTLLLGLSVITVFAGQMVGVWLWRQRHTRRESTLPQKSS